MEVVHGVGPIDRIVFEEDEDMVVQEVMKLLQDGRRRSSERTRSYETKERKDTRPPKAQQPEPPACQAQTSALFYSVDGDVVPKYPVEFNSDAASSVMMETPGRHDASMRRRRSPETRFTYNESLQQDIIEEIDMVKFRYNDALDNAEPAKPKRLLSRSTSTKTDLTPRSTHTEQTSTSSTVTPPPPKESITTAPTAAWSPSGLRHLLPKLPCGGLAAISDREYYTSATPTNDAPVESPLTCYSPRHHRCHTTSNVLADIHKADDRRRRRRQRVTKRLDAVASACALREDAIDDATTELDSHHRAPFSVGATSAFNDNRSALSSVTSGSHSFVTASSRTATRFSWEGTSGFSGTATNDYSSPGRKSVFSNTESFQSSRQSAFSNSDSLSFFILAENPDDLGYAASFM